MDKQHLHNICKFRSNQIIHFIYINIDTRIRNWAKFACNMTHKRISVHAQFTIVALQRTTASSRLSYQLQRRRLYSARTIDSDCRYWLSLPRYRCARDIDIAQPLVSLILAGARLRVTVPHLPNKIVPLLYGKCDQFWALLARVFLN